MDACLSYKYSSDIGLERLSYQSKIISINIRISLLLSVKGESKTCPVSEIAIIILSYKWEGDRGAGARENRGREGYGRREREGREVGDLRGREAGEKCETLIILIQQCVTKLLKSRTQNIFDLHLNVFSVTSETSEQTSKAAGWQTILVCFSRELWVRRKRKETLKWMEN